MRNPSVNRWASKASVFRTAHDFPRNDEKPPFGLDIARGGDNNGSAQDPSGSETDAGPVSAVLLRSSSSPRSPRLTASSSFGSCVSVTTQPRCPHRLQRFPRTEHPPSRQQGFIAHHAVVRDLVAVELRSGELRLEFCHCGLALLRDEIYEVFDQAALDRVGLGDR